MSTLYCHGPALASCAVLGASKLAVTVCWHGIGLWVLEVGMQDAGQLRFRSAV